MTTIPLIRVAVLRPLLKTLVRLGAPVDRYLDEAALPHSVFEDPERFIPLRQASRLLRTAAAGEGLLGLALAAGAQARIEDLGTFGHVILGGATLRATLGRVVDAAAAFNSGEEWWLEEHGDAIRLYHRFVDDRSGDYDDEEEFTVAVVVNLVRRAAGASWRPLEMHWRVRPSAAIIASPLFEGTRHVFPHHAMAVTIASALLDRPMPTAALPRAIDVAAWHEERPPVEFASIMREVIHVVSPRDGHPRIESAATALGLSVRTLQRRLSDHGLTFDQLVKTMRLGMAAELLQRTDTKIIGIALDLGYSDHAHFTRAFHKWSGFSPMEYRRRHRAERVA